MSTDAPNDPVRADDPGPQDPRPAEVGSSGPTHGGVPTSEAPGPARRKTPVALVVVLVVVLLGIGGFVAWAALTASTSAAVGECLTRDGQDATHKVDCSSSDAQYKVVGRVEDKTQIDASISACSDFPDADASYWEGPDTPNARGVVLCLQSLT